tara:strand:- start:160 stop:486 length:327 start_codon:yes stop_codon:yes gene_type:complete
VELTNNLRDLALFVNDRTHAVELLKFIDNHNGVVFSALREHIDMPIGKRQNLAYPLKIMIDKGFIYKYKSHMKNWTMYGEVKLYKTTVKGKQALKILEMFSNVKEKHI